MTEWYEQPPLRPQQEFFILIGLWILGFVAGGLVVMALWMTMTGQSIIGMEAALSDPKYSTTVQVMQSVSAVFMFLLPAWLTARIVTSKTGKHLGISVRISPRKIMLVVLIMFFAYMAAGLLADLNKAIPVSKSLKAYFDSIEKKYADSVSTMIKLSSFSDYLISLFVIALIPAVVEEFFFRGAMQQILLRWFQIPFIAILITSFIFSCIHFSWYLFLARLGLGLALGYIFYYTGNLLYSIAAHFFNNGFIVTLLYIQHLNGQKIDLNTEESIPIWISGFALPVTIFLIIILKRLGKPPDSDKTSFLSKENQPT